MSPVFDSGQITSTRDDRLQHDRPRLLDRVEERLLAGGDERDFLRVDRMMLAVVDDHAHVLQRKAGDRAGHEHLLDALLHRGHELMRDHAALGLVDELEAGAALARLDAQRHLAELPGAARLLLVPVEALGLAGDRLAIRDARRPRVDLELELASPSARAPSAGEGRPARAARSRWSSDRARRRASGSSAIIRCSTSEIRCSSPRFLGVIATPCIGVGNSSGRMWM